MRTSPLLLHPVDGLTTSSGGGGGGTETEGGENYMIMIHKLYVERLQSYLLNRCRSDDCEKTSLSSSAWTTISTTVTITTTAAAATTTTITRASDSIQQLPREDDRPHCITACDDSSIDITNVTNHHSSTYVTFHIVHIPQLTGVSQARRGYIMLYIIPTRTTPTLPIAKNVSSSSSSSSKFRQYLNDLSPMIRQNISWIYPIQHQSTIATAALPDTTMSSDHFNDICKEISNMIWTTLFSSKSHFESSTRRRSNNNSSSTGSTIQIQDMDSVLLRVDCYPKNLPYLEGICRHLQQQCTGDLLLEQRHCKITTSTNTKEIQEDTNKTCTSIDPFDGPIPLTMSKSKCTHKLSINIVPNMEMSGKLDVYWGIEYRNDINYSCCRIMDIPLNHEAADEIIVEPGIEQHHQDSNGNITTRLPHKRRISQPSIKGAETLDLPRTSCIVPLSRAYYKLHEIWYTYLYPHEIKTLSFTSAIDLGAAPGGWTQVLLNHMNVTQVLAIDRAQLAHRDRFILPSPPEVADDYNNPIMKHIFHVPTTLENLNLRDYYNTFRHHDSIANDEKIGTNTHDAKIVPPKIFSYLVCDASVQRNVLLPMIIHQLQQEVNMNIIQWTIPSVVIITLKLPFKTIHSIRRQILDITKQVPSFIQTLSTIMFGNDQPAIISWKYRIIHCMANSDSERTLIIIFDSP